MSEKQAFEKALWRIGILVHSRKHANHTLLNLHSEARGRHDRKTLTRGLKGIVQIVCCGMWVRMLEQRRPRARGGKPP